MPCERCTHWAGFLYLFTVVCVLALVQRSLVTLYSPVATIVRRQPTDATETSSKRAVQFLDKELQHKQWVNLQARSLCIAQQGAWIPSSDPFFHANCNTAYSTTDNGCEHSHVNFDWQVLPHSCPHDSFIARMSANETCAVMGGRTLLVVGDSLSEEFSYSLMNRVYEGAEFNCKARGGYDPVEETIPCNKLSDSMYPDFTLITVRNDRLSLVAEKKVDNTTNFYEFVWVDQIAMRKVDIILLNRGAHYEPDGIFFAQINETLRSLRTFSPKLTIVWRTTSRGFEGSVKEYFNSTPLTPAIVAANFSLENAPYHGNEINIQNSLMKEFLALHFPGVLLLDVTSSTSLRIDSRRDFLHYCIPGPIDNWVNLFLHSLKIAKSVE